METPEIKINTKEGTEVLIIREGEALPLKEPVKLALTGNIDTVSRFVSKRKETLMIAQCHVVVHRSTEDMSITLKINETDFYSGSVKGQLSFHEDFIAFGINRGKKYTPKDLADFIKMHRYCFEDKDVAMKLVSDLRSFKAKVNKEIEKTESTRGDKNILLNQIVESNIPESFSLKMPIFKGDTLRLFQVDINISPRDQDMDCFLESVEANDIIHIQLWERINSELKLITDDLPTIVVIED